MVAINRGDVISCDLSPVIGSEQSGIRPAVILQIDPANLASKHTIIAPFTSRIREATLRSHVFVSAGNGGLIKDSVILCEQIRVIDKQRIAKVLGSLNDSYMDKIEKALSVILGLNLIR